MLLKYFNKTWEKERDLIEIQLKERLKKEIKSIDHSMKNGGLSQDDKLELNKLRNQLVVRESMAVYESEEIARNGMQLRASYLALVMSSLALIISVTIVLLKL